MAEGKSAKPGNYAVRAQKRPRLSDGKPWQKLELFPTPPWAARALFEEVLPGIDACAPWRGDEVVEDPAAGLGHLAEAVRDYTPNVVASDVYTYPLDGGGNMEQLGVARRDFLDPAMGCEDVDWIITNPPFGSADKFLERALDEAHLGVALLLRINWLEGGERYSEVYARRPPSLVAPFAERVNMCEGGWDPAGGTATFYAWFVWARNQHGLLRAALSGFDSFPVRIIPPGQREKLTRSSDLALAARCVPGFIAPSRLKKTGGGQETLDYSGEAACEAGI